MSDLPDDFVPLARTKSDYLDSILGYRFPLLDGQGFVAVIDYMGNDGSIVQAARTSYGNGTKTVNEDRGLIRYLFRHLHTTPVEMCELKLFIKMPMDSWRQMIRHRMASVNEYSTRYSEALEETATTAPDAWRLQGKGNKQGSFGTLVTWPTDDEGRSYSRDRGCTPGEYLSDREKELHEFSKEVYQERLEMGVSREVARKDLPLSTYTQAYWKIDLHNLFHFLALRMDSHAQQEIRDYATLIGEEIVAKWVPTAWEAFNDYHFRRGAMILTRLEKTIISAIHAGGMYSGEVTLRACSAAKVFGWLEYGKKVRECPSADHTDDLHTHCPHCAATFKVNKLKRNRERAECEAKLEELGLQIPWATYIPALGVTDEK